MHGNAFEAKNELETKLLAAIAGELSGEAFMCELVAAQIFIPVKDDRDTGIKGLQMTTLATPLVVQDEAGANTLVAFTSPERAREFMKDLPGYSGGLLTEVTWLLERMEPGYSITVNPGMEVGMDLGPEAITEMRGLLAAEASKA